MCLAVFERQVISVATSGLSWSWALSSAFPPSPAPASKPSPSSEGVGRSCWISRSPVRNIPSPPLCLRATREPAHAPATPEAKVRRVRSTICLACKVGAAMLAVRFPLPYCHCRPPHPAPLSRELRMIGGWRCHTTEGESTTAAAASIATMSKGCSSMYSGGLKDLRLPSLSASAHKLTYSTLSQEMTEAKDIRFSLSLFSL